MKNDLVVISFYTNNWLYPKLATQLNEKCLDLGLNADIRLLNGSDNWKANTRMKSTYIRKMLDEHKHVLWIDADATLYKVPELVFNQSSDFLLCKNTHMLTRLYQVGVMAILSNNRTKAFCDKWIEYCTKNGGTDEMNFDYVMREFKKDNKISVDILPPTYHYVKATDPVSILSEAVIQIGISCDENKMKEKIKNKNNK